jgi:hypothetical protein
VSLKERWYFYLAEFNEAETKYDYNKERKKEDMNFNERRRRF